MPERPDAVDPTTSHMRTAPRQLKAVAAIARRGPGPVRRSPSSATCPTADAASRRCSRQPAARGQPRAGSPSTRVATRASASQGRRRRSRRHARPCPADKTAPWSWAPRQRCSTCVAPRTAPSRRASRRTPPGRSGSRRRRAGRRAPRSTQPPPRPWSSKLGAATAAALGVPAVMSAAYLDLELKRSAQILATASRGDDGGRPLRAAGAGRARCPSPRPCRPRPSPVQRTARTPVRTRAWATTAAGTVSAGDDVSFDTLTLKAVQGAFSLEGGGDGPVVTRRFRW